jgi:hypothetical protein
MKHGVVVILYHHDLEPFCNWKDCGLPMLMVGEGPGLGCGLSCACINRVKNKLKMYK